MYGLTPEGALSIIAGEANQLTVIGATACLLGKAERDNRILYVSTPGGSAVPIHVG